MLTAHNDPWLGATPHGFPHTQCLPMALPSSLRYSLLPRVLYDAFMTTLDGPVGTTPAHIWCGPMTWVFSS